VAFSLQPALDADPSLDADLAVCSAVLHDTMEDTVTGYEELLEAFGEEVARGVLALTKKEGLPKAEAMADSLRRIRERPREIWAVKMADRIANLGPVPPLGYWGPGKCRAYAEEGQGILDALSGASRVLADLLAERIALWRAVAGPA
jgi:(p)ppGpp synthase/HD superfamily hydrolase